MVMAFLPSAAAVGMTPPPVDFVRDVRPILSRHCFTCHGPSEEDRKAGLSLLDLESATADLGGAFAVVPGDRAESELWLRINDTEDPMPPRSMHKPLSSEQIELLGRWIDEGASYAPHWAYVSPPRQGEPDNLPVPVVVDDLIRRTLSEQGLQPARPADRTTLLRRATFDLTGLPPTPQEIDAFLADESPDAFERNLDRLLASHHFGERLATAWLDLVRYADTVGYHGDQDHKAWPYRDWVINAFNENMPFDRFTEAQLAGDLLSDADESSLIGSCYNRLLQTSHEGGVQLKEYRAIYMADRVRNVSEVWMGATIGCAQCHDHKYDPFTARDFHTFGAFFADIDDEEHLRNQYGGLNTLPTRRSPEMRIMTPDAEQRIANLNERQSRLTGQVDSIINGLADRRRAWATETLALAEQGRNSQRTWIDDTLDTGGQSQGDWTFTSRPELPAQSGSHYRIQKNNGLVQHYTHETDRKTMVVEEGDVFFCWVHLDPEDPPQALMIQCNTMGDWQHRATWGGDQISYGLKPEDWDGYRRQGELPPTGTWTRLEVPFSEIGLPPGTVVNGVAFTQFGGTVCWDRSGVESPGPAPRDVMEILATPQETWRDEQHTRVANHHASLQPEVIAINQQLAAIEQDRNRTRDSLPEVLYSRALETPREVRVLPRGDWLDESGELVEPAVPAFMGSIEPRNGGRADRLDLARWLLRSTREGGSGEMTARVFVNRIWAMLFGQGLCPSLEDFGGQGQPPTHPELLDILAVRFMDSGWDIKKLFRELMRSDTYRQSSFETPELVNIDPENLLHARQARFRLPAEMVRDTTLQVSGLLHDKLGGPSVKPPQPSGYYRHLNFPKRRYQANMNPEQWRRGVYIHWQRQYLHPMLKAFDAPTREECTAQRSESNTPLAALVLMNDPTYVEAARVFAQNILALDLPDDRSRISHALRQAISRTPSPPEVEVLQALLAGSREHYRVHPQAAEQLLAVGAMPRSDSIDVTEIAAWTEVARTILNLHETITRE